MATRTIKVLLLAGITALGFSSCCAPVKECEPVVKAQMFVSFKGYSTPDFRDLTVKGAGVDKEWNFDKLSKDSTIRIELAGNQEVVPEIELVSKVDDRIKYVRIQNIQLHTEVKEEKCEKCYFWFADTDMIKEQSIKRFTIDGTLYEDQNEVTVYAKRR